MSIPPKKCRTPQQKYLIPLDLSPSKLQDQLSETPCCSEGSGWLLFPAHPRVLLHLGDPSWLPVQLPSTALGCVWEGQGGQMAVATT